ncbi:MAG: 30S ribosomal protein S3 [Verrucomicrobiae bacterium]|nr:30S ribosomal protein S3 [Verrucomicrobiae bacterium]MDW8344566.1 30S ribosomal protein S3 [Verrucomicrobiae bacterium]
MGQKVNPVGFRVSVTKDWLSKWYAEKREYAPYLLQDLQIRDYVKNKLASAAVPKVLIERFANRVRVIVYTARPGVVIGRKGAELEKLKSDLAEMTGKEIYLEIREVKDPEVDAQLVAENVALQLERRISFRRAMKKAVQTAMEKGAMGVKIQCGGRLGGAELARREKYRVGKIPLHTLRADIDYGFAEANTVYGKIGVKVWICKGERPGPETRPAAEKTPSAATAAGTPA